MFPEIRELYRLADSLEEAFLRRNLRRLVKRLEEIKKLRSSKLVTPKSLKAIEERTKKAIREFAREFAKDSKKLQQALYKNAWELQLRRLGIKATFQGIPQRSLRLIDAGLTYMKNYTADMVRIAQNELAVAIMNGDSYERVINRLLEKIPSNGKRRIPVMARDQVGRVMQQASYDSLKSHEDRIAYYLWQNPLDEKTTIWCRNRVQLNPWPVDVVNEFIQSNPTTYKNLEITDPKTGTFLHPHIQCRSILTAISKSEVEEEGWTKSEIHKKFSAPKRF